MLSTRFLYSGKVAAQRLTCDPPRQISQRFGDWRSNGRIHDLSVEGIHGRLRDLGFSPDQPLGNF